MPASRSPTSASNSPRPLVGPCSSIENFYRCLEQNPKGKNGKKGESQVHFNSNIVLVLTHGRTILESFCEFARWYARSKSPFVVFEDAWAAGLHQSVTEQGSTIDGDLPR
jgi:hypothetical protein